MTTAETLLPLVNLVRRDKQQPALAEIRGDGEKIRQRAALKRDTGVKSVAGTVSFLVGEEACSITGQNIFVDAGFI